MSLKTQIERDRDRLAELYGQINDDAVNARTAYHAIQMAHKYIQKADHQREMLAQLSSSEIPNKSGATSSKTEQVGLISRQSAIDTLKKAFSDGDTIRVEENAFWHHGKVLAVIESLPSASYAYQMGYDAGLRAGRAIGGDTE